MCAVSGKPSGCTADGSRTIGAVVVDRDPGVARGGEVGILPCTESHTVYVHQYCTSSSALGTHPYKYIFTSQFLVFSSWIPVVGCFISTVYAMVY
jgi:hypothetical protein